MKQFTALAWKEWHDVRWFLFVALGVFVGLPVVGGLQGMAFWGERRFYFDASPWVLSVGGVLAVLVAVGAVCHDLGGRREDFLRSRPLFLGRWLLVKYFMGLAVAVGACVLPLALEAKVNLFVDESHPAGAALTWYPFLWTAVYSLAFLAACLVRRMAHAAMLAVAAMLLVYFLPLVMPALQWLSIDGAMEKSFSVTPGFPAFRDRLTRITSGQIGYAFGMLAISAAALAGALLAVVKDWRVESGAKTMYGAVGAVLLILFSGASARLANNLPVLQEISLEPGSYACPPSFVEGSSGVLFADDRNGSKWEGGPHTARAITLDESGIHLGKPVVIGKTPYTRSQVGWSEQTPSVFYVAEITGIWHDRRYQLRTISLDGSPTPPPLYLFDDDEGEGWLSKVYIWRDRLYMWGGRLVVVDIEVPLQPKLISVEPARYGGGERRISDTQISWSLPLLPGVPARQRLEADSPGPVVGDLLYRPEREILRTFRLDRLDDDSAHFVKIGESESSLLDHIFGTTGSMVWAVEGWAFQSRGIHFGSAISQSGLSVFDTHDPARPRVAGHFNSYTGSMVCPLPDGRALVGGNKIYLVGTPRGRK